MLTRVLKCILVSTLTMIIFCIGCAENPQAGISDPQIGPVQIEQNWSGEIKIELRKEAPSNNFISTSKEWEKLWKSYRGEEEIPTINFQSHLILVAVNSDPNQIAISPELEESGNLKLSFTTTLMGFTNPKTCKYQFVKIKRDGIKSVQGVPID